MGRLAIIGGNWITSIPEITKYEDIGIVNPIDDQDLHSVKIAGTEEVFGSRQKYSEQIDEQAAVVDRRPLYANRENFILKPEAGASMDLDSKLLIRSLKALGVTDIVSISAANSYNGDISLGDIGLTSELVFYKKRNSRKYRPFSQGLNYMIAESGTGVHEGLIYLVFTNKTNSGLKEDAASFDGGGYKNQKVVIGSSHLKEAVFAKKAGIGYACVAVIVMDKSMQSYIETNNENFVKTVMPGGVDTIEKINKRYYEDFIKNMFKSSLPKVRDTIDNFIKRYIHDQQNK